MMDEFALINNAKEKLCYASMNFVKELGASPKRGVREFDREFVLPDYVNSNEGTIRVPAALERKSQVKKSDLDMPSNILPVTTTPEVAITSHESEAAGRSERVDKIKDTIINDEEMQNVDGGGHEGAISNESDSENEESLEEVKNRREHQIKMERLRREQEELERQALLLSTERFTLIETLFHPKDIGLSQCGIPKSIVQSIEGCDSALHAAMFQNILLIGGNAKIPHIRERIEQEVRSLAPTQYTVRVSVPADPINYAWQGMQLFSRRPDFIEKFAISKDAWQNAKMANNCHSVWKKPKDTHCPAGFTQS
jgi:hypothetical protein